MNTKEFREFGNAVIDYIADYLENIRELPVLPSVEPGYLQKLLPSEAPIKGEPWQKIMTDVHTMITPGLTHWHSPNFHAYYPTANSFPGIVGELLSAGLGIIHEDWHSSPGSAELEIHMMNWLGKTIGLPPEFLNCDNCLGGGVIQNSASESTLVGLLSGKTRKIQEILKKQPFLSIRDVEGKLIAYTSEQSNSSVEKAGLLASIKMRLLPTDNNGCLRGITVSEAILEDISKGLIPCAVIATLGTTGTCAFDNLTEIGPICLDYNLWLHVDAAYAGSAFVCPEYRHLMNGIEFVDSFNINPHKWMLVNSDCSAMWFRNAKQVEDALKIKPDASSIQIPKIENWQIPNVRRFRALKLWFVLRIYGVEGIRKYIRNQIHLAKFFKDIIENDNRFEICTQSMGLICFRLKGDNSLTQQLIDLLTKDKNIFVMPYYYQKELVVRFVICSRFTEERDILYAWNEISMKTNMIMENFN